MREKKRERGLWKSRRENDGTRRFKVEKKGARVRGREGDG